MRISKERNPWDPVSVEGVPATQAPWEVMFNEATDVQIDRITAAIYEGLTVRQELFSALCVQ